MTVEELIRQLESCPKDATVVTYEPPGYDLVTQAVTVDLVDDDVDGLVEDDRYEHNKGKPPTTYVWVGNYK